MAITVKKALISMDEIDTFLSETVITAIYAMAYVDGGYVIILYN